MPNDATRLLRGVLKFLGVVVAAGLAGAGIGIGLAKLSGNEEASAPEFPATSEPSVVTTSTQTATTPVPYKEPSITVLSVRLGPAAAGSARVRVTTEIRMTNRNEYPLEPAAVALSSGDDDVPLDAAARDAAGPLLRAVQAGASATGELRFTLPAAVAQRVRERGSARLHIAKRTKTLKLVTTE